MKEIKKSDPTWGGWVFEPTNLTLKLIRPNGFVEYEVDLEDCNTSASLLDWIFQVLNKSWAGEKDIFGLLNAIEYFLKPQENICSWGDDRKFSAKKFIQTGKPV